MEHTQVTATVDNGIGDTVTVELGTVPTWSLPLTADWKRTYRPVALDMAASEIPLPDRGVTVRFHACNASDAEFMDSLDSRVEGR